MSNKVRNNCIVEEVTSTGQRVRYGEGISDVCWLQGIARVVGLKVGDKGDLVYISGPSMGYWTFKPYSKN